MSKFTKAQQKEIDRLSEIAKEALSQARKNSNAETRQLAVDTSKAVSDYINSIKNPSGETLCILDAKPKKVYGNGAGARQYNERLAMAKESYRRQLNRGK